MSSTLSLTTTSFPPKRLVIASLEEHLGLKIKGNMSVKTFTTCYYFILTYYDWTSRVV